MKNTSSTKVGVVGLGYVGLPTVLAMSQAGLTVIGIDISEGRVSALKKAKSYISEIPDSDLKAAQKNVTYTTDFSRAAECNTILITVPTPLTKNKTPDLTAIEGACNSLAPHLKKGTLVVLESTSFPGTTEEIAMPILEKSGLKAGKDFHLAFAPERVDPGNKDFPITKITKVVGGLNAQSTKIAVDFYKQYLPSVYPVSSIKTAETTKLLENIFRLVNISLVNELKMLTDKMGVHFLEVLEAAKTKPYGFMAFKPGPGVGGHCIPLDPFYLSWKAKEYNFFTRFIELAGEINELMPHNIVTKINWVLNKYKKPLNGSKILVIGVAYKKDIDDPRESPASPIIADLLRKHAKVTYHDPFIPTFKISGTVMSSKPLTAATLKAADCVVILTDHSNLDTKLIAKNAKLIVDTRGLFTKRAPHIYY